MHSMNTSVCPEITAQSNGDVAMAVEMQKQEKGTAETCCGRLIGGLLAIMLQQLTTKPEDTRAG